MKAFINQHEITYQIEGPTGQPEERVLLASATDLSANTQWGAAGFVVAPFLPAEQQIQLCSGLEERVRQALRQTGLTVDPAAAMSRYHHYIADDQARHLAVVRQTKELPQVSLPVPPAWLEARVSALCGRPVQALNPFDNQRVFHLRIVRPHRTDNNPLHRDVWLPDYADCINIYVPVTGSTAQSSLCLVPGSHWWPENRTERTEKGAVYNGVQYTVPAVTGATQALELLRPNPSALEALIFSPYLLHGGAVNLNEDATRISLEMRFWPVP